MAAVITPEGGAMGPALALGAEPAILCPVTIVTAADETYSTGGVPLTLPDSIDSHRLVDVILTKAHDGTRRWEWDGSQDTPKLIAYDAFATEEGNGTNIFSITLRAVLLLK